MAEVFVVFIEIRDRLGKDEAAAVFSSAQKAEACQPLSVMAMTIAMRRLGASDWTVHGMRSAARSWMADNGVEFELAEACLAHAVGNAVVQAYQRSSMLERRRPLMQNWANFVCGSDASNAIPLRQARP
jgi:integrase